MDIAKEFASIPARYPELKGQVAIVTGSSRGIGQGIAARFAREGMKVVVTGLDAAEVAETADDLTAQGAEILPITANLGENGEIDRLFAETLAAFGTVDVLVNNAADLRRMPFDQVSEELIDYQLAVNVKAPMMLAQQAGAIMRAKKSGCIVNVTTPGALRTHLPGLPYDVTKGAIDPLTRALGVEWIRDGVRVNAIAPGWANTWKAGKITGYFDEVAARIPIGRPVEVLELAAAVAFLVSPDASYMVGQVLYVDGGVTAQLHPPGQPI
ncbi:MAG: SDR family oxidoreductase [Anaerolineae bacterium]|nr:SDR family oxidoreductase [Anaerolineae bacterium]